MMGHNPEDDRKGERMHQATREEPRPLALLRRCTGAYPQATTMAAKINEAWSRYPEAFRDFSYVPAYDATNKIVSDHGVSEEKSGEEIDEDFAALEALLRWRLTKGVYEFDPEIFDEVASTQLDGELPIELFFRLPERCVYAKVPGAAGARLGVGSLGRLLGFFAHLGWDEKRRMTELVVTLDHEGGLRGHSLDLAAPTVVGCLAKWHDVVLGSPGALDALEREVGKEARDAIADPSTRQERLELDAALLKPFLSLILYLCAANAEISARDGSDRRPANPVPKRVKKRGEKLFAAQEVREWDVAYRTGAALRRARSEDARPGGSGTGRRQRPHVRRAHWHTFWTGPRSGEQTPILKWLPPIPINVDDPDELPAVVRDVTGARPEKPEPPAC